MHVLRTMKIDTSLHLRVTFVGEPAIDDGGPMREYMRLLIADIMSNNTLFCDDINARYLQHNIIELKKRTFYYVGRMLSMSIVHGGPPPAFFAEPVSNYIVYGLEKVKVGIEDIVDETVRQKLYKVYIYIYIRNFSVVLVKKNSISYGFSFGIRPKKNLKNRFGYGFSFG